MIERLTPPGIAAPRGPYTPAVRAGDFIFLSGQVPVDPATSLKLDAELLGRFAEGYRHLAYLQTKNGFTIKHELPQLKGPVVQALYAHGKAWLEGAPSAFPESERPAGR